MSNLNYNLATIKSFIDLAAESLENQKKYLKNIHDKDLQQYMSYESNVCLIEAATSYLETAIELIQSCQIRQESSLIRENKDRTTIPEGSGSISTEQLMGEIGWLPK